MRRARAAALLLVSASAPAALAGALLAQLPSDPGDSPDGLIVAAASWVAAGATAYLFLCITVTAGRQLAARGTGRPVRAMAGTPKWLRPFLATALGATVIVSSAEPALAGDGTPHRRQASAQLGWPVSAPARTDAPTSEAPTVRHEDRRVVVVAPGDSLWSIATDALAAPATRAAVAREWPRWWRANRDVIGDRPELIRPGQRLVSPPPSPPPGPPLSPLRHTPSDPRSPR